MATRSDLIIVNKNDEILKAYYRHWDGYPEGAGTDIKNYLEKLDNYETIDPEECGYEDENIEYPHGDENYWYLLNLEGNKCRFRCYCVPFDADIRKLDEFELVEDITFEK